MLWSRTSRCLSFCETGRRIEKTAVVGAYGRISVCLAGVMGAWRLQRHELVSIEEMMRN